MARALASSRQRFSNLSGTLNAAPDFLARLNAALASVGLRGVIGDPLGGYRTGAQEDHLHATESGRVGTSSTSMHVQGWASDVLVNGSGIRNVVSDKVLARFGLIAPYGDDTVHVEDRRGLSWAKAHAYHPGGAVPDTQAWRSCTLTWYDPALGGTNSSSGRADPHSATSSGEPYSASAFTCAAPEGFAFGTMLTFRYRRKTVTCKVNDRGGAISGSHFDLSRAAANALGIINAGKVSAEYAQVGAGAQPSSPGITRPGGSEPASGAGLEALYKSFLDEGKAGDNIFAAYTGTPGGARRMVSDLILPGVGPIPGTGELLQGFDPFNLFKQGADAIQSTQDLLKLIGWMLNPRNILRVVEFLVGLSLLFVALRVHLRVFGDAAMEKGVKLGRSAKRGVKRVKATRQRAQELKTKSRKRSEQVGQVKRTPGLPKKPQPKLLGSGGAGGKAAKGGKAASGGRVASAASKATKVIKLVPK